MKPDEPIPIVIQADDAVRLTQEALALHSQGYKKVQQSLHDFKKAGDLLIKAKEAVGHGGWSEHLKKHWVLSAVTARQYMRIAREWAKVWDSGSIKEGLRILNEDQPEEVQNESGFVLRCPRCIRLNISRRDCEQCQEVQQEQRDREKGGSSTRPGRPSSGGGRSSGNSTAGTTSRPCPSKQASLQFDTAEQKAKQQLQRLQDGVDEAKSAAIELLNGSRAADFHELLIHHHLGPDVQEKERFPIVDGQTEHIVESEVTLPALEKWDAVCCGLKARIGGDE